MEERVKTQTPRNDANPNETIGERAFSQKKIRLLDTISTIEQELFTTNDLEKREIRDSYLEKLKKLKAVIVKTRYSPRSDALLVKCEEKLNEINQGTSQNSAKEHNVALEPISPDSTDVSAELTPPETEKRKPFYYENIEHTKDIQVTPADSTVIEDRLCSKTSDRNLNTERSGADNEVSSSQSFSVPVRTSERCSENSQHRTNANETSYKKKTLFETHVSTQSSIGSGSSSHFSDIGNEKSIRTTLQNLNLSELDINENVIAAVSKVSIFENQKHEEEIEEWDKSMKSSVFSDILNNQNSKRLDSNSDKRSASERGGTTTNATRNRVHESSPERSSVHRSPRSMKHADGNSPTRRRKDDDVTEHTNFHVSAREKLSHDIEVVHRVGESGKINASLKVLKADLSKLNSCGRTDSAVPRSDAVTLREDSLDRSPTRSPSRNRRNSNDGRSSICSSPELNQRQRKYSNSRDSFYEKDYRNPRYRSDHRASPTYSDRRSPPPYVKKYDTSYKKGSDPRRDYGYNKHSYRPSDDREEWRSSWSLPRSYSSGGSGSRYSETKHEKNRCKETDERKKAVNEKNPDTNKKHSSVYQNFLDNLVSGSSSSNEPKIKTEKEKSEKERKCLDIKANSFKSSFFKVDTNMPSEVQTEKKTFKVDTNTSDIQAIKTESTKKLTSDTNSKTTPMKIEKTKQLSEKAGDSALGNRSEGKESVSRNDGRPIGVEKNANPLKADTKSSLENESGKLESAGKLILEDTNAFKVDSNFPPFCRTKDKEPTGKPMGKVLESEKSNTIPEAKKSSGTIQNREPRKPPDNTQNRELKKPQENTQNRNNTIVTTPVSSHINVPLAQPNASSFFNDAGYTAASRMDLTFNNPLFQHNSFSTASMYQQSVDPMYNPPMFHQHVNVVPTFSNANMFPQNVNVLNPDPRVQQYTQWPSNRVNPVPDYKDPRIQMKADKYRLPEVRDPRMRNVHDYQPVVNVDPRLQQQKQQQMNYSFAPSLQPPTEVATEISMSSIPVHVSQSIAQLAKTTTPTLEPRFPNERIVIDINVSKTSHANNIRNQESYNLQNSTAQVEQNMNLHKRPSQEPSPTLQNEPNKIVNRLPLQKPISTVQNELNRNSNRPPPPQKPISIAQNEPNGQFNKQPAQKLIPSTQNETNRNFRPPSQKPISITANEPNNNVNKQSFQKSNSVAQNEPNRSFVKPYAQKSGSTTQHEPNRNVKRPPSQNAQSESNRNFYKPPPQKPNSVFSKYKVKPSERKPATTAEIKEKVKGSTEFYSPLQNMYTGTAAAAKTGKGYGFQKFRIPKIRKPEPVPTLAVSSPSSEVLPSSESSTSDQLATSSQPATSSKPSPSAESSFDNQSSSNNESVRKGAAKRKRKRRKKIKGIESESDTEWDKDVSVQPMELDTNTDCQTEDYKKQKHLSETSEKESCNKVVRFGETEDEKRENELMDPVPSAPEKSNDKLDISSSATGAKSRERRESEDDVCILSPNNDDSTCVISDSDDNMPSISERKKNVNSPQEVDDKGLIEILHDTLSDETTDSENETRDQQNKKVDNLDDVIIVDEAQGSKNNEIIEIEDNDDAESETKDVNMEQESSTNVTDIFELSIPKKKRKRKRQFVKKTQNRKHPNEEETSSAECTDKKVTDVKINASKTRKNNSANSQTTDGDLAGSDASGAVVLDDDDNAILDRVLTTDPTLLERIQTESNDPVVAVRVILDALRKSQTNANSSVGNETRRLTAKRSNSTQEPIPAPQPKSNTKPNKKIASDSTESLPGTSESTLPIRNKRGNRELENLQADIEKMRNTKNNIFTATTTRTCRQKKPVYTDRLVRPKKTRPSETNIIEKKSDSESDETNDEEFANLALPNRKHSVKPLMSDSDRENSEVKSTCENEKKRMKLSKKSPGRSHLSVNQPCPKSVKIMRFGNDYEEFDVASSDTDWNRWDERHGYRRLTVKLEKGSVESYLASIKSKNTSEKQKTKLVSPKKSNVAKKSTEPASGKARSCRKAKNSENVKRKEFTNKRQKLDIPKMQEESTDSTEVANESQTFTSHVLNPDKEVELEQQSILEDDNDDLTAYPFRNAFKDPQVQSITIPPISVNLVKSKLYYKCFYTWCDYKDDDVQKFAVHLNFLHKSVKWNGICELCDYQKCNKSTAIPTVKTALLHLLNDHLITIENSGNPNEVTVKQEPLWSDNVSESDVSANAAPTISEVVSRSNEFEMPPVLEPEVMSISVPVSEPLTESVSVPSSVAVSVSENSINSVSASSSSTSESCLESVAISAPITVPSTDSFLSTLSISTPVTMSMPETLLEPGIMSSSAAATCMSEPAPISEAVTLSISTPVSMSASKFLSEPMAACSSVSEAVEPVPTTQEAVELSSSESPLLVAFEAAKASSPTASEAEAVESLPIPAVSEAAELSSLPTVGEVAEAAPATRPRIRVRRFSGDLLSGSGLPPPTSEEESVNKEDNVPQAEVTLIPQDLPGACAPIELPTIDAQSSRLDEQQTSPSEHVGNLSLDLRTIEQKDGQMATVTKKTATKQNYGVACSAMEKWGLEEWRLMDLYKCVSGNCPFTTEDSKEFIKHLNIVHRSPKRNRRIEASCLMCPYCKEKFDTPEMLVLHLKKYKMCQFQCPYCLYRACRPVYIIWHQKSAHSDKAVKIYIPNKNDNKAEVTANSEAKPLTEVVLPYPCSHGCAYETISFDHYVDHSKKMHGQVQMLKCPKCTNVFFKLESLLTHLKLHGLGEYQCIYCHVGASSEDAMKLHLLQHHRTVFPKAVKRPALSANEPSINVQFENLEILDFDESLESLNDCLKVVSRDEPSEAVTLYRHSSDPDLSADPVSATGIYVLNDNMEYVLDVEATKKAQDKRKAEEQQFSIVQSTDDGTGPETNNESEGTGNLVIAVDSSDEEATANASKTPAPAVVESKPRKPSFPIGLSGTELYCCGFAGCTVSAEDYHSFKEHMFTCDHARNVKSLKCPHCNRNFQQNQKFFNHLCLHGEARYLCTLCEEKFTIPRKAEDHMKQAHKVLHSKTIPANPLKDNKYKDLYIVIADPEKSAKGGNKLRKVLSDSVSYKLAANASPKSTENTTTTSTSVNKLITKVFTLEDVEKNLPMALFAKPVSCGICSKYNSKVRSNIISHLKLHSTGFVTDKDITNPVPCMDKNDLMFNKMTNHAAYSSSKTDDKRIKSCVEKLESYYTGSKNEIIPAFVPKTLRFSCSAPSCNYLSTDATMLKTHWETLHPELNLFNCPHCGVIIPTEKINTHLRYHDGRLFKCYYCSKVHYQRHGVEKHMAEVHPNSPPTILTVRELTQEEIDELGRIARNGFDSCEEKDVAKSAHVDRWKCNLCKTGVVNTELAIRNHCAIFHHVNERYKCCLCNFSNNEKDLVIAHMNEKHESVSQVVISMYKEVNENSDVLDIVNQTSLPNIMKAVPNSGATRRNVTPVKPSSRLSSGHQTTSANLQGNDAEEAAAGLQNTNNFLVLPYPGGFYRCPFCSEFRTRSKKEMEEHIFKEKNYFKCVCVICGDVGVNKAELLAHVTESHNQNETCISMLTVDEVFEQQIQEALDYQQQKFRRVSAEIARPVSAANVSSNTDINKPVQLIPIELSDSSDDEAEKNASQKAPKTPVSSNQQGPFPCDMCKKVCSNKHGLNMHKKAVHGPNANASQAKKRKISDQSNEILSAAKQAKLPQSQTSSSAVLGARRKSTGEFHHSTTDPSYWMGTFSCTSCDARFRNRDEMLEHSCGASKGMTSVEENAIAAAAAAETKRKICATCTAIVGTTDEELQRHFRDVHSPLDCIYCSRILYGRLELERHVRNTEVYNLDCVTIKKSVVFMCPHCPFGACGQTYDRYMVIVNHIKTTHSDLPSKRVYLKVNNKKRTLYDCEVDLMLNKQNMEKLPAVNAPAKLPVSATRAPQRKRNVAVKSTSRGAVVKGNPRSSVKVLRLNQSFLPSEGKSVLPPKRKFKVVAKRAAASGVGARKGSRSNPNLVQQDNEIMSMVDDMLSETNANANRGADDGKYDLNKFLNFR